MSKLGIHCITYNHMPHKLPACVHSLLGQTRAEDLDLFVESDGEDPSFKYIKAYRDHPIMDYSPSVGSLNRFGSRCYYSMHPVRTNDFGYTMHQNFLNKIADNYDYVHFSTGDLYYVPTWAQEMLARADKGSDLVYCDALHNYAAGGPYRVLDTKPMLNYIDKSSFIVRTELAKQIGFPRSWSGADGEFVEKFIQKFPSARVDKVEQCLWVHN